MALDYGSLLAAWALDFSALEGSSEIQGSPERSMARVVVRDVAGQRWVLEKIEPENIARKQQIASQLDTLQYAGVSPIHPYRMTRDSGHFSRQDGGSWMIRPFVEGFHLNRDTYLDELWRMEAMTDFLIRMNPIARRIQSASSFPFSITSYAAGRMADWSRSYPKLVKKLSPSFLSLKEHFFPVHDSLPTAFCHGDYHPLNMIWGEDRIESVIDWEFCGVKPEMYDVALLLGCLGFDDPDVLIDAFVIQLVQKLRAANLYAPQSWETLFELMATIRTGWMSEWIRRSDEEAIELEVIYIDILVSQKEYILQRWV